MNSGTVGSNDDLTVAAALGRPLDGCGCYQRACPVDQTTDRAVDAIHHDAMLLISGKSLHILMQNMRKYCNSRSSLQYFAKSYFLKYYLIFNNHKIVFRCIF